MFSTQASTTQLCEFCHLKPRHSGHKYCSKTCAASAGTSIPAAPAAAAPTSNASTLCNYCQSKPKFTNFDYCGKYCAAQAAASPANVGVQPAQQPAPASSGFNPAQMAQTLASQFPQMKAYFATVNPQTGQIVPPAPGAASTSTTATPAASNLQPATASGQAAAPAVNTTCLIPGCGKPAHVDAKGAKTSDYCSKRHREEAVTSGLAEACIMCRKFPQSDKDYFCSRTCKDEATKKSGQ